MKSTSSTCKHVTEESVLSGWARLYRLIGSSPRLHKEALLVDLELPTTSVPSDSINH